MQDQITVCATSEEADVIGQVNKSVERQQLAPLFCPPDPFAALASARSRSRAPEPLPRELKNYTDLLAALHYEPSAIQRVVQQRNLAGSETVLQLLDWTQEAFSDGLHEIAVNKEEREL